MTTATSAAAPFLRQILLDPQGWEHTPPVFADWLEERGDPRGPLLRRRWKMVVKAVQGLKGRNSGHLLDRFISTEIGRFKWYVRKRFNLHRRPNRPSGSKFNMLDQQFMLKVRGMLS